MPSDHTLTELQVSDTEEENEETQSIHESVSTEFRMEEQIGLVYSANKPGSTGHSIIRSTNQKRVYILCIHKVSSVVSSPSEDMSTQTTFSFTPSNVHSNTPLTM
jgi:hypothetical protein